MKEINRGERKDRREKIEILKNSALSADSAVKEIVAKSKPEIFYLLISPYSLSGYGSRLRRDEWREIDN